MKFKCKCPLCNEELEMTITLDGWFQPENVMLDPKPENVKCPECGGEMVSRKGQYGIFWGCKKYPDCRGTRDSMGRSKAERQAEKETEYNKEVQPMERTSFNKRRWEQ